MNHASAQRAKKYTRVKAQRAVDKVDSDSENVYPTLSGFVHFGNITKERKQAENKHPVEEEGS